MLWKRKFTLARRPSDLSPFEPAVTRAEMQCQGFGFARRLRRQSLFLNRTHPSKRAVMKCRPRRNCAFAANGLGSARIDGYEVSYDGSSVMTHFAVVNRAELLPVIRMEPEALRLARTVRPDHLHGLSPSARESRVRKWGRRVDNRGDGSAERVVGAWCDGKANGDQGKRPDRVV